MKKLMKLSLALMMILGLVGCGGNDTTDEPSGNAGTGANKDVITIDRTNPFTGADDLSDKALGKRPVAVSVNNVSPSLPQYGISSADMIYEFEVEYGLTRLLAFWADYTKVPDLCSVRSARYFFPVTAMGYDAFYVHWGFYYPDQSYIDSLDFDEFEGLYNQANLYGRDQNRLDAGYALEHTSVFYGSKLASELENGDYRLDLKESKKGTAFNFAKEEITASDEECTKVYVDFGGQDSTFNYNGSTYDKLHNGNPHKDQSTGEQLTFKNIFILETDITVFNSAGRNTVDWQGDENSAGYYITNGTIQKIHWEKTSEEDYLKFYDENGKEIEVNKGKSYITYTSPGSYSFN